MVYGERVLELCLFLSESGRRQHIPFFVYNSFEYVSSGFHYSYFSIIFGVTAQQTQTICITFVQRRPNVFDVGQHCTNVIEMFCAYWWDHPFHKVIFGV